MPSRAHSKRQKDNNINANQLDKGFEPEFGARPLRRAIEHLVEDPLAEELLRGIFNGASGIKVECDNHKLLFFPVKAEKKRRAGKRSN